MNSYIYETIKMRVTNFGNNIASVLKFILKFRHALHLLFKFDNNRVIFYVLAVPPQFALKRCHKVNPKFV